MLIGVTGRIGEGKTSVAEHLRNKYGFLLLSFSTPLKEAVAQLFGLQMTTLTTPVLKTRMILRWKKTSKEIMQIFGTECMRGHFGEDFWVKHMQDQLNQHSYSNIVIDDVRFPEEVEMVYDYGGLLIRVIRPNNPYTMDKAHVSEQLSDAFTAITLRNEGTLDTLRTSIDCRIKEEPLWNL